MLMRGCNLAQARLPEYRIGCVGIRHLTSQFWVGGRRADRKAGPSHRSCKNRPEPCWWSGRCCKLGRGSLGTLPARKLATISVSPSSISVDGFETQLEAYLLEGDCIAASDPQGWH